MQEQPWQSAMDVQPPKSRTISPPVLHVIGAPARALFWINAWIGVGSLTHMLKRSSTLSTSCRVGMCVCVVWPETRVKQVHAETKDINTGGALYTIIWFWQGCTSSLWGTVFIVPFVDGSETNHPGPVGAREVCRTCALKHITCFHQNFTLFRALLHSCDDDV